MAKKKRVQVKKEGLGDKIEKITKATGIKSVVDKISEVTGLDCGCSERKKILNKSRFFAKYEPECIDEDEYKILKELVTKPPYIMSTEYQANVLKVYNKIFRLKQKVTNCGTCWENIKNQCKTIVEAYDREGFI